MILDIWLGEELSSHLVLVLGAEPPGTYSGVAPPCLARPAVPDNPGGPCAVVDPACSADPLQNDFSQGKNFLSQTKPGCPGLCLECSQFIFLGRKINGRRD